MPRADSLPDDVERLKALLQAANDKVDTLRSQLRSRDVLIEHLKLQLARLKRMQFGRSSEQLAAQIGQLELSLEELEANAAAEPVAAGTPGAAASAHPVRKPLPAHLPREPEVHEPPGGTCHCPQCGGALRSIGEDVAEILEYVPEHWTVHRQVRPKYSCARCQHVSVRATHLPSEAGR